MGIISRSFPFLAGTVFGIYVTQNYNVPNINKIIRGVVFTAKLVEEKYRKPKKPGDDAV